MLRRILVFSVGALALLVGLGAPGQVHAQHMREGFAGGMHPGFRRGFNSRFNRGFFDPRFDRFDRRFDRGSFDPRFDRRFDRFEDRVLC